jgi:hypothetical protein
MKNSKPIINLLVATKLVLYTVLEYLDPCTLKNLYISVKSEADSKYVSLAAVLQSYLYIRLHMINTDRTYYYFVYDNSRFQNI